MSVVTFQKVSGDRANLAQKGVREYTDHFQAITSSPRDTARVILIDPRCPKPYQPHPEDPGAFVRTVAPQQHADSELLWDVEVNYSSELDEEQDPNPLARPADISYGFVEYTGLAFFDADGKPALNTAGEPFEPAIEIDYADWVISVSKNVAKVPGWITAYQNAVNDGAVRVEGITYASRTLKLKGLRISSWQVENRTRFRTVSFELHFRSQGWTRRILNRGYHELVLVRTRNQQGRTIRRRKLVPILIHGERPSEPAFLDRSGQRPRDSSGEPKEPLAPEDILVLEFNFERRLPFNLLPLK